MSYVARLLAMSTRSVARPALLSELAQSETAPAVAEAPTTPNLENASQSAPATVAKASVPSSSARQISSPPPGRTEPRVPQSAAPRAAVAAPRTVGDAEAPAPGQVVRPTVTIADERPTVVAQPAAWLREDAVDPIESYGDTDDVRDVLRAVRHWTSAAPVEAVEVPEPVLVESIATPVELASPLAPVEPRPAMRQENDLRVSIENVTVTVEDVPAAPSRKAAAREPAPSTRLARHYIRGT